MATFDIISETIRDGELRFPQQWICFRETKDAVIAILVFEIKFIFENVAY